MASNWEPSNPTDPEPNNANQNSTVPYIIGGVLVTVAIICLLLFGIFYLRWKRTVLKATPAVQDVSAPEQKTRPPPVELCAQGKGADVCSGGDMQTGESSAAICGPTFQEQSPAAAAEPAYHSMVPEQCGLLTISELPGSYELEIGRGSEVEPLDRADGGAEDNIGGKHGGRSTMAAAGADFNNVSAASGPYYPMN
ncbi:hypothetical protein DHEL01_v209289 [Diaporthe helianthi]|uniref:Uncharacterized protein n=1 Tax=Diaporthe helianthi TaxID=158607 RepID=A0A2P5HQ03_DIAHE|nr:hypothetical protein DHEL01_v209289 [Diaporthe helianthi]